MRVKIILLALISLNTVLYAQKTKKVVNKNGSLSIKETYYVLKSDQQIKHGSYKKEVGGKTVEQGEYNHGAKTGIWEYYGQKGNVVHRIDVEKDSILYDASENKNAEFDKEKYARPLIVLGGIGSIYQQVRYVLQYPSNARRTGVQGKVLVQMIVDDLGEVEDVKVYEGVGDILDKEAVRVMKLIDVEFLPAQDVNGQPIKSDLIVPITFRLG